VDDDIVVEGAQQHAVFTIVAAGEALLAPLSPVG
jgi:hypothetical protein